MAEEEYLNVPLVIYVNGDRKVVGEATVKGTEVRATLYPNANEGQRLIDALSDRFACFSFSWGQYEKGEYAHLDRPDPTFDFKPAYRGEFPGPQQMQVKYINVDKPSGIEPAGEDVFKQEEI